jgi:uncharacterized membrane protein
LKTSRVSLFSVHDLAAVGGLLGALAFIRHWQPLLPAQVPTHWNAAGQVDAWTPKGHLFWAPLLMVGAVWLLLAFAGRKLRSGDARQQRGARALADFRGWVCCGLALMVGYVAPMAAVKGPRAVWVGLLLLACAIGVGFVPLLRANQKSPPIAGASLSDYRWGGLIYWNPRDSRLWVEKRLGLGWTLNFGRPLAWALLVLLLAPAVAALVVLAHAVSGAASP